MNEEAIKAAYDLFLQDGYTKTIDDFKELMISNPDGQEAAYDLFVQDGYTKDISEFQVLMGVSQTEEEIVEDDLLKKKEETESIQEEVPSDLPSEDGSLEQSSIPEDTQPVPEDDFLESSSTPEFVTHIPQIEEGFSIDGNQVTKEEFDINQENEEFKGTLLEETTPEQEFQKSTGDITDELIERQEEWTVPNMKYLFSDYGFDFKEAGLGDKMVVYADNGEKHTVNLDPLLGIGSQSEADDFKKFIEENKTEFQETGVVIDADLIKKNEEYTVRKLNAKYIDDDFTFEETGAGDAMIVTGPNGTKHTVNLDPWFGFGAQGEADELKDFIERNKKGNSSTGDINKKVNSYKKIHNKEEILKTVKVLNSQVKKYKEDINTFTKQVTDLEIGAKKMFGNFTDAEIAADSYLKKSYNVYTQERKKLQESMQFLQDKDERFKAKGKELDRLAGEYSLMQSQQGTMVGATLDGLNDSFTTIASGIVGVGIDTYTSAVEFAGLSKVDYKEEIERVADKNSIDLPEGWREEYPQVLLSKLGEDGKKIESEILDIRRKELKYFESREGAIKGKFRNPYSFVAKMEDTERGIVDLVRDFQVPLVGIMGFPASIKALKEKRELKNWVLDDSDTTEEYSKMKEETFLGGSYLGLVKSVGGMMGGLVTRSILMASQVSDHLDVEMGDNPDFDNITESEKYSIKAPIGIAVGVLESIGFRNILSQKGLLNGFIKKAILRSTEKTTAKTFGDFIKQDVEHFMARGALRLVAGGAAEFETGFAQEFVDLGVKELYNITKDKKMFQQPDSWEGWAGQMLYAGAQEAVGGFIMGVPGAVGAAVKGQELAGMPEGTFEIFEEIIKDPAYKDIYETKLNTEVEAGTKTQEQADEELETFNKILGVAPRIPVDYTTKQKKIALELLYQKSVLESEIQKSDSKLVVGKQKLLDQVNDKLEVILKNTVESKAEQKKNEESIPEMGVEFEETAVDEDVNEQDANDIEAFFGDDVDESVGKRKQNLSINKKGGADIELTPKMKKLKDTVIKIADRAANSISKILPETRIILHESNSEYLKYATQGKGRGEFNPTENVIHINLSEATKSTIPHEIFHAVFINKVKTDARAAQMAEVMVSSVRKTLSKDNELAKRIDSFASQYTGDQSNFQNEERLAELIGLLSSKEFGYTTLSKPAKNAVIDFFKKIAKRFGIELGVDFGKTDESVIDLINVIAKKTAEGEVITTKDVEYLDNISNKPKPKTKTKKSTKKPKSKTRQQKFDGKENFDKWKGNNKEYSGAEIQDIKTGEPVVIRGYHGTTNEFYEFDSNEKGNVEGHLGKVNYFTSDYQDASSNYQADGSDITSRIEREAERLENELSLEDIEELSTEEETKKMFKVNFNEIKDLNRSERAMLIARKKLLGTEEKVLDLYIKLNNPAVIGNGMNYIEIIPENLYEDSIEDAVQEVAEENDITEKEAKEDYYYDIRQRAIDIEGIENPLIEALQEAINENTYDYGEGTNASEILEDFIYDEEISLNQLEKSVREGVSYSQNEDGEITSSQIVSDMFKNLGYDGIVLTDVSQRFKGMGLGSSTSHIHVFNDFSNQIKLADGTNVTFNSESNDIRQQKSEIDDKIKNLQLKQNKKNLAEFEKDKAGKDSYSKKFLEEERKVRKEIHRLELLKLNLAPAYEQRVSISEELDDLNKPFKREVGNIYFPRLGTVTKGEKISEESDLGGIYEAEVDGYLFRGVSLKDYNRIKKEGFINTDLRGTISNKEGINLATSSGTAFNYLPEGVEGVVMAIKVSDKSGLFMIGADDYVRSSNPIPFTDVEFVTTPVVEGRYLSIKDGKSTPISIKKVIHPLGKNNPAIRQQKGLINFSEKDAIKFSKIGVDDARTIQAMNIIGLSGIKFTKEGVNNKIKESLNKLYEDYESSLLNKDSREITKLMQYDVDTAIEDALPDSQINQLKGHINNESSRKEYISKLKQTQYETANQWVSYLKESDYSDSFKYLMLDAVLTNNYDLKTLKYKKRANTTTRNISPFDAGTLAMIYSSDSKNLLKSYIEIQQDNLDNIIKASQVKTTGEGKWLKFNGGPNAANLKETANSLSQLVQDTYWCTKTNAFSQLRGGDFYVYVTGTTPKIAIRMDGDRVGEVRGNASSKQDLDDDMLPVAEKFLKENIPNNSGKKWLDSIAFNKKAKAFLDKINTDGIGVKEIKEYVSIVAEGSKYNTDYGDNGFVTKIKDAIKNGDKINPDIKEFVSFSAKSFNSKKTKYVLGNFLFLHRIDIKSLGTLELITGNVDFRNSNVTDLGNLKSIGGYGNFSKSKVESLGNLKSIGEGAAFYDSKITDLRNLKSIGGGVEFYDSNITDLGNLESIGGSVNFRHSNVESLGKLESIGSTAEFGNSKVESLGNLKSIGGNANFHSSKVESLGNLETIGGNANFNSSKVTDLGNLKSIGRTANFRDSDITDLGNLESIGGDANFYSSKITDLRNLKSIGATAEFSHSNIESLGNLKSIGRDAIFSKSKVTDLGNLETIGGDADFHSSKVESLGNLKSIGGDAYFHSSNIESLGNLESIGGNVDFRQSNVTDLGNLESIGGYVDFRQSNVTDLGNLESIGGVVDFRQSNVTDLGNLESIGGYVIFSNSKVESLGNLKSIGDDANFSRSKITDLRNLESIGRTAVFSNSDITDLGNLESIGGNAEFSDSQSDLKAEWESRKAKPSIRQQKSVSDVIREGRINHFTDATIRDFLVRVKGYAAKDIDKLLEVAVDLFDMLPNSFKNIKGGVKVGAKLFDKVNKFRTSLEKKNNKNTRLTEAELNTKVNEFAKEQRKTYKTTEQINKEVKSFKEKLVAKNSKKKKQLNSKEINKKVKTFKDGIVAERNDKRELSVEKVALYEAKETKSNNRKAPLLSQQEIVDKAIEFLETQPEYISESDTYTVGSEKKGTKETKRRKGFSVSQASMLSDLQKFVGTRPTQDMASKIRMARIMLSHKKRATKDLNAIKKELRNFIRKSLPLALYTKPEVISMVRKVTLATEDNIDNIYNEVLELAAKKNIEALSKSIEDILTSKFTQVQSGRLKGITIDLATKERIDSIKERLANSEMSADKIIKENEKLLKEFSELQKDPIPSAETQSKMVDLQLIMEYNNSLLMENTDINKVESLDLINTSLNEMLEFGRTSLREELAEARAEYLRQFEGFYGDIVGEPIDMSSDNVQQQLNKAKRARGNEAQRKSVAGKTKYALNSIADMISNVFTSAEALRGLMDKISLLPGEMFGGIPQEMVTERVDASNRKFKQRKMIVEMILKDKLKEIYGKSWSKESRRARQLKNIDILINEQEYIDAKKAYKADPNKKNKKALDNAIRDNELMLTQNQMYYLYNQFKDPANFKAFGNMYAIEFIEENDTAEQKKEKAKINEANAKRIMKEMESKLTPEIKAFADWQVEELFPSLYENYNDVYKKIYRTNMPWNEHYAGRIYREGFEVEPLDLLGQGGMYKTSVGASSTKARINNTLAIQAMDGTDALASYLNDMEYFAAYAETIRDVNKLFTNDYISSAITSIHGKTTMNLINDAIKKIAARGQSNSLGDRLVNSMNSTFAISRLALSPVIYIKQLISTITYANDIGFINWIAYGVKNLPQLVKTWKEITDNSVYMQDRKYESILKNIESYSESSMKEFVPNPAKEWFVNFMMYQIKAGDRHAIMLGGMPNYLYYKSQALKDGKTEQEAIDIAIIKFERDTKNTQQSGDQQDKDILQTSNPAIRAMNMFLTTPKQYLRKEIQAVRSLGRKLKQWDKNAGKGTITENIRTLMIFHVVMPMIFQYISAGLPGILADWDEDDDARDLLRAAVIGNINGLFAIGEVVNTIGDYLTHKPWVGQSSKTLGIIGIALNLGKKADIARKTIDPIKRAEKWKAFLLEGTTLTSIPAPTLSKWIDNIEDLGTDGNLGKDLLRLANFSKYVIDGPKKKKSKSSKVKNIYQQNEEYQRSQRKVAKEKKAAKNRIPMYAR